VTPRKITPKLLVSPAIGGALFGTIRPQVGDDSEYYMFNIQTGKAILISLKNKILFFNSIRWQATHEQSSVSR